jgi:hypothetical protein
MSTLLRALGLGALCLCGVARGQFAPPGTGGTTDAGSSAASPAATNGDSGGSLNIGLPPVSPRPEARTDDNGPLAVVQANQTLTSNAMIGFVDAQPIFLNDLFRPIDADLRRLAATAKSLTDFERGARALIDNQIAQRKSDIVIVAATEAQLTDREKAVIDAQLALGRSKLIADHGGSMPAAERALAATGSSLDREMNDLRRGLIRQMHFERYLMPRIVITRQMLLDAYERDPKRWQQPAQIELFTITLAVKNWLREPSGTGSPGPFITNPTPQQIQAAEAQALAQGRRVVEQLKAGADFAALVEDNDSADGARSFGGRRMISRGAQTNKQEEDYVFSLPANTIGEPLLLHEADYRLSSVVVAKVGQKTEARSIPFSEAQTVLGRELRSAQLRELQLQEMEKLDRGAAIEAVDRMRDVALAAAVTRYAMK